MFALPFAVLLVALVRALVAPEPALLLEPGHLLVDLLVLGRHAAPLFAGLLGHLGHALAALLLQHAQEEDDEGVAATGHRWPLARGPPRRATVATAAVVVVVGCRCCRWWARLFFRLFFLLTAAGLLLFLAAFARGLFRLAFAGSRFFRLALAAAAAEEAVGFFLVSGAALAAGCWDPVGWFGFGLVYY